jgi:tape measure domain-containing protein
MDWELRLGDAMSRPAQRMARALGGLETSLRGVDRAAQGVSLPRVSEGMRRSEQASKGAARAAREAEGRLRAQMREDRARAKGAEANARQESRAKAAALRYQERQQAQMQREQARGEAASQRQAERAAAQAQRSAQAKARQQARVEAVERRQAERSSALASRQQGQALRERNRQVEAQNRSRIRAEVRAEREIQRAKVQSARAIEQTQQANAQSQAEGAGALPGQIGLLMKLAGAAVLAAAGVAKLTYSFSKSVLEAVDFREGTIKAISTLTKDAGAGERAFDMSIDLAARFNLDPKQAVQSVHAFMSKGFTAEKSKVLIEAMADLKVLSPKANLDKVSLAIEQIKGKGRLQMEELQGQLAEAGVSVSLVLEQLAKKYKKTQNQIRAMISAGKIDGEEGVEAIIDAIKSMGTGKLGEAAEQAAQKSISGLVNGIKMRLSVLPIEMAKALGGSVGVEMVKGALRNVVEALNPEKSQAMYNLVSSASTFADTLFQALFGEASGEGAGATFQKIIQSVADGFKILTAAVKVVAPIVSGFLGGFGEVLGEVYGALRDVGSGMAEAFGGDNASALKQLGQLARSFGRVAAYLVVIFGAVATVIASAFATGTAMLGALMGTFWSAIALVQRLVGAIGELRAMFSSTGVSAGTNLWQGLVNGMNGGIGPTTDASSRLGEAAKSGVQTSLDIHSPSRVMEQLGGYTAQGFAQGVEGGQGQIDSAMGNVVAPPVAAPASASASTSVGGVSVTVQVQVVTQATDPKAIGAEAGAASKAGALAALEDVLAQLGLSPVPTS